MTIVDKYGGKVDTSAYDTEHRRQLLMEALGGDEKDYAMLLLMLARKNHYEMAEALGISRQAVSKRVERVNAVVLDLGVAMPE